jgi:subtilase family serine protease
MFQAVTKAARLVAADGGGEVSMSWGLDEFSTETLLDVLMRTRSVVYFAASGDTAGTWYPCTSPNVVCVGGTVDSRNPVNGRFQGSAAWTDTGGGTSPYEPRPAYQNGIANLVGTKRGVPDISGVADPSTGVWIYNASWGGWTIWGGTSVATPINAGIANSLKKFQASSAALLSAIYSSLGTPNAGWADVADGTCGYYQGFKSVKGWDKCTGVGVPRGINNFPLVVVLP